MKKLIISVFTVAFLVGCSGSTPAPQPEKTFLEKTKSALGI